MGPKKRKIAKMNKPDIKTTRATNPSTGGNVNLSSEKIRSILNSASVQPKTTTTPKPKLNGGKKKSDISSYLKKNDLIKKDTKPMPEKKFKKWPVSKP